MKKTGRYVIGALLGAYFLLSSPVCTERGYRFQKYDSNAIQKYDFSVPLHKKLTKSLVHVRLSDED